MTISRDEASWCATLRVTFHFVGEKEVSDAVEAFGDLQSLDQPVGGPSIMLTNSNMTPGEIARVRSDTKFSPDDVTFGRTLFTEGKADVACLWEPDVSLALASRAGAHRSFSTSRATELIADILVANKQLLAPRPDIAEKLDVGGRPLGARRDDYDPRIASQGSAVFTKPSASGGLAPSLNTWWSRAWREAGDRRAATEHEVPRPATALPKAARSIAARTCCSSP